MRRPGLARRAQAPQGGIHHHLAKGCPHGRLPPFKPLIEGATPETGVGRLRIADDAGVVDLFAAVQSEIGGGCSNVVRIANEVSPRALLPHITLCLRRVIFISHSALGGCLDFKCMGLRAVGGRDQIIMRGFGTSQSGGTLGGVIGQPCEFARLQHLGRRLGA